MATHILHSAGFFAPIKSFSHNSIGVAQKRVSFSSIKSHDSVTPIAKSQVSVSTSLRRLADYSYKPSVWDYNYLQSLKNNFNEEKYKSRAEKLKNNVKMVFKNFAKTDNRLDHFELIDELQRLGIAYHFEEEIKTLLECLYISRNTKAINNNLYATALEFRLFRQHGYYISQDTFKRFFDDKGCFKKTLYKDIRGMMSLYEASYFSFEEDNILKEVKYFTTEAKKDWNEEVEPYISKEMEKSFELPLHWRSPRLDVRRFIDIYEKKDDKNPLLLELAKLDFNMLQGLHLDELQNQSRWWRSIGLAEKLGFARDRLVECFLWSVGMSFEPQFKLQRTIITRAIALITVIDDIYDVYGTLDELQLFTDAVDRWDINTVNRLPNYMKTCFVALYNFVNEIVYEFLKGQDLDTLPYLKKAWFKLVNAYMVEARWYHSGYKPTFNEYMENGWISITSPLVFLHAYVGTSEPISIEELEFLTSKQDIIHWAAFIFRISDDLGTSTDELKRGDVPKSIQCYIADTGVSEEVAREHMLFLMKVTWEKINTCRDVADSPLSRSFVEKMLNLVRSSHSFYLNGDGHGVQDDRSIDRVSTLLFQPIAL